MSSALLLPFVDPWVAILIIAIAPLLAYFYLLRCQPFIAEKMYATLCFWCPGVLGALTNFLWLSSAVSTGCLGAYIVVNLNQSASFWLLAATWLIWVVAQLYSFKSFICLIQHLCKHPCESVPCSPVIYSALVWILTLGFANSMSTNVSQSVYPLLGAVVIWSSLLLFLTVYITVLRNCNHCWRGRGRRSHHNRHDD